ncbi:hypothetical protein [Rubinisphaera margarita]|uniref:hypothetical protein n=1 Tax=Rubinisphaera margarita TaxID=2909586 RepID=UPI001EE937D8|nr:hypothetical protein [Rubinisphaera margarita]MCG6158093.1 hypothetical protein [Rubinisphaera margarita]
MEDQMRKIRYLVDCGISKENIIREMAHEGFSIIEAIKAIREVYNISLRAAKQDVSSHPSYIKAAEDSIPIQDAFYRAFTEYGKDFEISDGDEHRQSDPPQEEY